MTDASYEFHAAVAGSQFHDRSIMLSNCFAVNVMFGRGRDASFEMVYMADGAIGMKPLTDNVAALPRRFAYNPDDLGPTLSGLLSRSNQQHAPIAEMLDNYIAGLEQILKAALRKGRI